MWLTFESSGIRAVYFPSSATQRSLAPAAAGVLHRQRFPLLPRGRKKLLPRNCLHSHCFFSSTQRFWLKAVIGSEQIKQVQVGAHCPNSIPTVFLKKTVICPPARLPALGQRSPRPERPSTRASNPLTRKGTLLIITNDVIQRAF